MESSSSDLPMSLEPLLPFFPGESFIFGELTAEELPGTARRHISFIDLGQIRELLNHLHFRISGIPAFQEIAVRSRIPLWIVIARIDQLPPVNLFLRHTERIGPMLFGNSIQRIGTTAFIPIHHKSQMQMRVMT